MPPQKTEATSESDPKDESILADSQLVALEAAVRVALQRLNSRGMTSALRQLSAAAVRVRCERTMDRARAEIKGK